MSSELTKLEEVKAAIAWGKRVSEGQVNSLLDERHTKSREELEDYIDRMLNLCLDEAFIMYFEEVEK